MSVSYHDVRRAIERIENRSERVLAKSMVDNIHDDVAVVVAYAKQQMTASKAYAKQQMTASKCGMRSHHDDCDCGGVGGDR